MLDAKGHAALKVKVAQLAHDEGLRVASKKLGVGADAVARFLGGLPVRAGTLVLLEQNAKALVARKAKP